MAVSTTSVLPPAVQAYYDQRFLIRAKCELAGYQFGQKRDLPSGKGKTVYFTRYLPLTKISSPLDETLTGGLDPDTRQQLTSEEISATAALWGDYVQISKLASITSIDKDVSQKVDILGQQAGESVDYYVLKAMGQGLMRRRADADA
ncbi:MAG: N4-gp56 family major capsid protein, partial [Nanoarchaeota archaeon]